jgi:Protein of unknown function, DUF547
MFNLLSRRSVLAAAGAVALSSISPLLAHAAGVQDFAMHKAGATVTVDHAIWDRQLKAYIAPDATGLNRVDYKRWKATGHKDLKSYLAALQKVDPTSLDRPEQFAFWANLYNARTIDIVLDSYPVKSIKDVRLGGGLKALVGGGPWQANVVKVRGVDMSLDDIENKVMRPVFKDPRVHYSVNCASYGCPNLQAQAFTGATLEAQLEVGAKAFINHPRGIMVEGGKIKASTIYSWFEADFGGNVVAVLDHVRKYAEPDLKKQLEGINTIATFDYGWTINDIAR